MATLQELGTRTRERVEPEDFERHEVVLGHAETGLQRLKNTAPSVTSEWASPSRATLVKATAGWMAAVFAFRYVFLPAVITSAQVPFDLVPLVFSTPAFAMTASLVVAAVALFRPRVRLPKTRKKDNSPEIAATAGSLAVWAAGHQLIWGLMPLTDMEPTRLIPFLALNVLESSLFGVMLASFTNSPTKAFGLGALFQLVFIGLTCMLAGLL